MEKVHLKCKITNLITISSEVDGGFKVGNSLSVTIKNEYVVTL